MLGTRQPAERKQYTGCANRAAARERDLVRGCRGLGIRAPQRYRAIPVHPKLHPARQCVSDLREGPAQVPAVEGSRGCRPGPYGARGLAHPGILAPVRSRVSGQLTARDGFAPFEEVRPREGVCEAEARVVEDGRLRGDGVHDERASLIGAPDAATARRVRVDHMNGESRRLARALARRCRRTEPRGEPGKGGGAANTGTDECEGRSHPMGISRLGHPVQIGAPWNV